MAGLQYATEPDYAGFIFRRTYRDLALPDAIMSRSKEWLAGSGARWSENRKEWAFPSGATLTFAYLEHDNDVYGYQGAAAQYIGWDELTQFAEHQYRYLFSRARRAAGSRVPVRVRGATNPGGLGHDWVLQRFMIEHEPDRMFLPSTLDDNPYLDRESYLESLSFLDPFTRQQLLDGDWFARPPGTKFRREWFTVVDDCPRTARNVRYWDLAATEPKPGKDPDWTAGALVSEQDGRYWIRSIVRSRSTPQAIEQLIRQTAETDGVAVPICMEQEPGASGVSLIDHYARRVLKGFTFRGIKTTGSKEIRANPVSSAAEANNVLLVRGPWISAFLDEAVSFPGGAHDDQVDAVSGAIGQLALPRLTSNRTAAGPPRPVTTFTPR